MSNILWYKDNKCDKTPYFCGAGKQFFSISSVITLFRKKIA